MMVTAVGLKSALQTLLDLQSKACSAAQRPLPVEQTMHFGATCLGCPAWSHRSKTSRESSRCMQGLTGGGPWVLVLHWHCRWGWHRDNLPYLGLWFLACRRLSCGFEEPERRNKQMAKMSDAACKAMSQLLACLQGWVLSTFLGTISCKCLASPCAPKLCRSELWIQIRIKHPWCVLRSDQSLFSARRSCRHGVRACEEAGVVRNILMERRSCKPGSWPGLSQPVTAAVPQIAWPATARCWKPWA